MLNINWGEFLLHFCKTLIVSLIFRLSSTNPSSKCGITSNGGFVGSAPNLATKFKRPSWQDEQVTDYLKKNGPTNFGAFPNELAFGYNTHGRGFPDIAAYANYFPVIIPVASGDTVSDWSDGTSLAAPLTAGLFTLANEELCSRKDTRS